MISIKPKRKEVGGGFQNINVPSKKTKQNFETEDSDDDDLAMAATQLDFLDDMDATQVDFHGVLEKEEVLPSFRLTAYGDDDVLRNINEKEMVGQWSEEPFVVGRAKFLSLPEEHKNRISRKHFEIHCCTNEDTNVNEFWLIDCSANGTMVDGELGYSGKKTLLEDGSAIGVLLTVEKDQILFGYSFSTAKGTPKKPQKPGSLLKGATAGKKNILPMTKKAAPKIKQQNGNTIGTKSGNNGVKTNGTVKVSDDPLESIFGSTKANGKNETGKKENGMGFKGNMNEKTKTTAEKAQGEEKPKGTADKTKSGGAVFAVPAPKVPGMTLKPKKTGFMQGVRFALVGYNEAALADPKKQKLIQDLTDRGATHVLHPSSSNVDVVVLNRNYFKEPSSYDIDLQQLTSSLRVRFTSNTRWLEDCVREGRKLDISNEILGPNTGGVVVLDTTKGNADSKKGAGLEPRIASCLASMLREDKRNAGAKWKIIAPLSLIAQCAGVLEGLEGSVEVLKGEKGGKGNEFMLGVREANVAGYRHVLLLVNSVDGVGMDGIGKVVSVLDGSGLAEFAQRLHTQRKENLVVNKK